MKPEKPELLWRVALPDDLRLVASSWFESYRKGGHAPEVPFETYRAGEGAIIDRLIKNALVLVAFHPSVPDEICGWLCRDPKQPIAHYVYVKQAYRRYGIAWMLCQAFNGITQHTHETRVGRHLASKLRSKFNPYLLEKP